VPLLNPCLRFRGLRKRIRGSDLDRESRRLYGSAEALELADARSTVVSLDGHAGSFARRGFDTIWKGHAAAVSNRVEQMRERFASRQRKNSVHSIRRERECRGFQIVAPCIGGRVGTQATNQRHPVTSRRGRQHSRASHFRELQRHAADSAGGAMDDYVLTAFY
jgi:hypothetical protein